MNSWIFYLTDSCNNMTAVVGLGANLAEAEASAIAKWEAFAVARPDYAERSPIASVIDSRLSTSIDANNMPGLIL